jgi:hypothetical protein
MRHPPISLQQYSLMIIIMMSVMIMIMMMMIVYLDKLQQKLQIRTSQTGKSTKTFRL